MNEDPACLYVGSHRRSNQPNLKNNDEKCKDYCKADTTYSLAVVFALLIVIYYLKQSCVPVMGTDQNKFVPRGPTLSGGEGWGWGVNVIEDTTCLMNINNKTSYALKFELAEMFNKQETALLER